jgi:hypothetical protein
MLLDKKILVQKSRELNQFLLENSKEWEGLPEESQGRAGDPLWLTAPWRGHRFAPAMWQTIDVEYEYELDPTDINPYETPIWQSTADLKSDLEDRPEFVKNVLMSTGIADTEFSDVLNAQYKAIRLFYRR